MKQKINVPSLFLPGLVCVVAGLSVMLILFHGSVSATQEGGSIGLEGRINGDPPKTGATITFPRDGSIISDLPTTVSGLCPTGLLVKIFKNNVFDRFGYLA